VNAADMARLRTIGRTYFLYLFLYSGLEFTLTFLTHLRFNFTSMDQVCTTGLLDKASSRVAR
jgi:hypothetical protein